jgi:hypothetical protein
MSELEKLCHELYDALELITAYIDEFQERGWDKHSEGDFVYSDIYKIYPFRRRLGQLLGIPVGEATEFDYSAD